MDCRAVTGISPGVHQARRSATEQHHAGHLLQQRSGSAGRPRRRICAAPRRVPRILLRVLRPERNQHRRDGRADPRPGLVRQRPLARDAPADVDRDQPVGSPGHQLGVGERLHRRRQRQRGAVGIAEPDGHGLREASRNHRGAAGAAGVLLLPVDGSLRRRAGRYHHGYRGAATRLARLGIQIRRVGAPCRPQRPSADPWRIRQRSLYPGRSRCHPGQHLRQRGCVHEGWWRV